MSDIILGEDGLPILLEDGRSLLLESDSSTYNLDPHGREPIGVNQAPSGGSEYPLIQPSEDVRQLFGDFYLSYPDALCHFQTPFRIAWLHGFGGAPADVPDWTPEPVHERELIVKDANDLVVFDSTLADSYRIQLWGSRLLIIEWMNSEDYLVCRCTVHVAWTAEDVADGINRGYAADIEPESAILDPRTYNRLPLRVSSLRVGLTKLSGQIVLESGYNVGLSVDTPVTDVEFTDNEEFTLDENGDLVTTTVLRDIPGTRFTRQVLIQANPGDGRGQVPGCEEVEPTIKVFGGARPDSSGNINLDVENCLRIQRPVQLTSESPREFRYGDIALTDTEAKAAIVVHNDCGPCCECDFYVRTYAGLKRQWTLWSGLAQQGEEVRDIIKLNKERWLLQKACREANPLRVILLPEPSCKVVGGAIYCNASKCCLVPVTFRFTFEHYRDGVPVTDPGFHPLACEVLVEGSAQKSGEERYAWSGTWPVFDVVLDYIDPQDTGRVSFRICTPACTPSDNFRMTVAVLAEDPAGDCILPVQTVPDEILSLWSESLEDLPPVRGLTVSKLIPLQNTNAFCAACEC